MARGGKFAPKHKAKIKVQMKNKCSDGSDEDYMIGEDEEFDQSAEEYSSLADYETEESSGEFEEERDSEILKEKIKRVGRPRGRKSEEKPRKKPVKEHVLRRTNRYKSKEPRGKGGVARKTKSTENRRRRRKLNASFDSDIRNPGSYDNEYTISDEEREQIREASEFCGRLASSSRSSGYLNMIKEERTAPLDRKRPGTKDKEKMVDMKIEVGKQMCGICLSEEGKRTVTGVLNCCSHYFCFACIMEWSKVETRCPLCKQRFTTIRTKQVDGGHEPRDVFIPVLQRNQVYQPSEEELRGYHDPYGNVTCTECHEGRDDALMLLCDLCDSPAHTYCVGLGCEVPEGNWYCDGCRPAVLVSSNSQCLNHTTVQTTVQAANNFSVVSSPVHADREAFDLHQQFVSETQLSQETGKSPSPSDFQAASGSGAFTLHERRRVQQHINHLLLTYRSRQLERTDAVGPVSGTSLFGSQIFCDVVTPLQPVREHEAPQSLQNQGQQTARSLYGRGFLQPIPISSSVQLPHDQASTSRVHFPCGSSYTGFSSTASRVDHGFGHQQLQPTKNSISSTGLNTNMLPSQFREVNRSSPQKEHVQSMVKVHLKSMSRNSDLDYITFKCIARTSTHTILAAVGLEHRANEVLPVQTRPVACHHLQSTVSHQTSPIAGQCSSCLSWFVKDVVKKVMASRLPLLSKR